MPLVPQIVDAVSVPVVAAGGIADGRGIAAAFALGAAGAQLGTAYLLCPEAATPPLYRDALRHARGDATLMTNVFSGRPARILVNRLALDVGPILDAPLDFPFPMAELQPLRAKAEQEGRTDFTPFWSGQAAPMGREMPAKALTVKLATEALSDSSNSAAFQSPARLRSLSSSLGSRSIAQTFFLVNLSGDVLRDIRSPPDLGRRPCHRNYQAAAPVVPSVTSAMLIQSL